MTDQKQSWVQARIQVPAAAAETAQSLLNGQGALSLMLTDPHDTPILEPGVGETPLWPDVILTAFFSADTNPDQLRAFLNLVPGLDAGFGIQISEVREKDWDRERMAGLQPMQFGENLWIAPTGTRVDDRNAIVVHLDPGLAFGTGTHPTTRLCLEWLARQRLKGASVVDFGCGSGILAVAAAKLGASECLCIDNDPQALTATRDNAMRNQVLEQMVLAGEYSATHMAVDFVVANILAGTLIRLAPVLTGLTRPGGRMALSGILPDQADEVAAAFSPGFGVLEKHTLGDWVLLSGQRQE